MEPIEFNENELLSALERSGYLLESEISQILNEIGFVQENNQVIIDPYTGKSREIDLIADSFSFRSSGMQNKCLSKIHFVFEIKNNISPVVLLTKFEFSPNIDTWYALKRLETVPEGLSNLDMLDNGYYEKLIRNKKGSIFTQYCSFQKKKSNEELMALHPDNIHSGLSKITQYCEEAIIGREEKEPENGYWRDFIYIPVLLLSDNLYELSNDDNQYRLNKVDSSILTYNYHFKNNASMAYVFVVTKEGFLNFINTMLLHEESIEEEMIRIRTNKK